MQKILTDFAAQLHLPFTFRQAEQLLAYGQCVWDKKDALNLTSAENFEEVVTRHLCDGLVAASAVHAQRATLSGLQLADVGAGCGYIGFTSAIALPDAQVTLVESLEKRCRFMNWAALKAGVSNVQVANLRLGQSSISPFDVVTERAMGQLQDIFEPCMTAVKAGGVFMAFQGSSCTQTSMPAGITWTEQPYQLPGDKRTRYLVLFRKEYA